MIFIEWFINKLLINRNVFRSYFEVFKLVEIVVVIFVSNVWFERGVSFMKYIKSRLRFCLKFDLFNVFM